MMPAGHHSNSDPTLLPLPKSSITWFGGIFARLPHLAAGLCQRWIDVVLRIGLAVARPLAANHFPTFSQCWSSIVGQMQTCQPSRFWRDSPAFLTDVLRPAKSWKCPAFLRSRIFCARAICNAAAVQITQLNVGLITEIPFDFSQKFKTYRGRIAVLQYIFEHN